MTTPPGPPPPYGPQPYGDPYGEQPPNAYPLYQQPPPYQQPPYQQPPPHQQPPYQQTPYQQPPYQQPPYQQPGSAYPPPPPPPYSQEPGYYPPPPPTSGSRRVAPLVLGIVAGLVVLAIVGGVALFLLVGKDTVSATEVKVGDCLKEMPGSARVLTVQTVGCDESHAGEVFAVLTMPDTDFPGQPAIDEYADRCSPELAAYSPAAMMDDSVQLYVLYPTAETWEQGDRAVTCIATLDPPRTGSIKR